ncbi:hypothetical protein [Vallitalea okinawensis]|nr:hypothetical protein [Vallitalea okinawensis]
MKKINIYYFIDGLDGVVAAKSLKQACKIVAKAIGGYSYQQILDFLLSK